MDMMFPLRLKTYYGFDDGDSGASVFVSNGGGPLEPLPLRCDIVNHSPAGFAWGYSGSGPAQLAVAILADYFGCTHAARALHQDFKRAAISVIREKHWMMTATDIVAVFQRLLRARPWLDRLAILDDGPALQVVDSYARPAGEFGRLLAVVPQGEPEDGDEVVLVLADGDEIALYRDQVSSVPVNTDHPAG
jgi:hypothetical protein